jgi:hypothetical protein
MARARTRKKTDAEVETEARPKLEGDAGFKPALSKS